VPKTNKLKLNLLSECEADKELAQNFPSGEFLLWFKNNKRDFPWRHNPSFYEVLVSEMMLQQTVASYVVPYFAKWIKQFPTLLHLANASSEEVLKAWEGLGYYSRARRLHEISKKMTSSCQKLPDTYETLISLKGIGDYTAKAILAFAYKKPEIAIDGNVLRVGARFLGIKETVKSITVKNRIQAFFDDCIKEDGTMAEALIELGATICKKKAECQLCPLKLSCKAYKHHLQNEIPKVAQRKKTIKIESEVCLCLVDNHILILRHDKNLMQDLCEFPKLEMFKEYGFKKENGIFFEKVKASYTHFQETIFPIIFEINQKIEVSGCFWVSIDELDKFSFSSGHRKIKMQLQMKKTALQ
jgi:A/G-specific adenine glycosylase